MRCRVCGKTLTGQGAFLGIGPVCRKHRAEALQPALIEGTLPTVPTLEDWKEGEPFELVNLAEMSNRPVVKESLTDDIIDFDRLTGRVKTPLA